MLTLLLLLLNTLWNTSEHLINDVLFKQAARLLNISDRFSHVTLNVPPLSDPLPLTSARYVTRLQSLKSYFIIYWVKLRVSV